MAVTDESSSGGKQWLYWFGAGVMWICGGAAVLLGKPVVGVALLIGAGGLLWLLSWRRRRSGARDGGSGERPTVMDVLDP